MPVQPLTPTNPSNLKGKSVLITGGASGLGLHAARFFSESGAYVTIADVQDGSQTATDLTNAGHKTQYIHCDVTNWDSQVKAFQSALKFSPTKTLDLVASYAGVDKGGHLVDYVSASEASLEGAPPPAPSITAIDVNLKGSHLHRNPCAPLLPTETSKQHTRPVIFQVPRHSLIPSWLHRRYPQQSLHSLQIREPRPIPRYPCSSPSTTQCSCQCICSLGYEDADDGGGAGEVG